MARSAAFAAKIGYNIKSNILVQDGGDLKSHIRNHILAAEGVVPDDRRVFQLAMLAGIEYDVDPNDVPKGFQFQILSPEEHQEFNQAHQDSIMNDDNVEFSDLVREVRARQVTRESVRPEITDDIIMSGEGDIKPAIRDHIAKVEGVVPDDRRVSQLAMLAGIEYDVDRKNAPEGFKFKILSPEEHEEFNQAHHESIMNDDNVEFSDLVREVRSRQKEKSQDLDVVSGQEHRSDQLMERNSSSVGQVNSSGVYAQKVQNAANKEMGSGLGMSR